MKTKNRILVLAFFFACLSFPNLLKSQPPAPACNYMVANNLTCPVDVTVDFYSGGVLCSSFNVPTTIVQGTPIYFSCVPCGVLDDVVVTVVSVGGNTANTAVSIANLATAQPTSGCTSSTISNIFWAHNDTTINP